MQPTCQNQMVLKSPYSVLSHDLSKFYFRACSINRQRVPARRSIVLGLIVIFARGGSEREPYCSSVQNCLLTLPQRKSPTLRRLLTRCVIGPTMWRANRDPHSFTINGSNDQGVQRTGSHRLALPTKTPAQKTSTIGRGFGTQRRMPSIPRKRSRDRTRWPVLQSHKTRLDCLQRRINTHLHTALDPS